MISLKTIKLNNFLSHASSELVFSENSKILLDGASGSGKSSIIEALVWCLYGEARSSNRDLVKHGQKNMSVVLDLYEDETETTYRIERGTTNAAKNSLSVTESNDGKKFISVKSTGMKDTQNFIDKEILHSSYQLFINSVVCPQDNIESFVKQTASKRKDLLLEMTNVESIDEYYEKAKEMLSIKNGEMIALDTSIQHKEALKTLQATYVIDKEPLEKELLEIEVKKLGTENLIKDIERKEEANKNILQKERNLNAMFNDLLSEQLLAKKKVDHISTEIKLVEKIDVSKTENAISSFMVLDKEYKEIDAVLRADYNRISMLNALMANIPTNRDYESEVVMLEERLRPLVDQSKTCPAGDQCPFLQPIKSQIAFLQEQIQDRKDKKLQLDKEQKEYTEKLSMIPPSILKGGEKERQKKLASQLTMLPDLKARLVAETEKILSLPSKKEELKDAVVAYEKIGVKIVGVQEELMAAKKDIENINDSATKDLKVHMQNDLKFFERRRDEIKETLTKSDVADKMVKELSNEIKDLQKSKEYAKIDTDSLVLVKEAFGSKGLKTVVIDYLIPRLEDRINEILSQLSDFTVMLDTQRASADGEGIIEGLFINIKNPFGQETSFDSFSGGEKIKITLAISEALASLQKCSFRILDEAIVSLDNESTESLVEVLGKIQSRYKQMLCVSHLVSVKEVFDQRVEIIKINGTSQIK